MHSPSRYCTQSNLFSKHVVMEISFSLNFFLLLSGRIRRFCRLRIRFSSGFSGYRPCTRSSQRQKRPTFSPRAGSPTFLSRRIQFSLLSAITYLLVGTAICRLCYFGYSKIHSFCWFPIFFWLFFKPFVKRFFERPLKSCRHPRKNNVISWLFVSVS